MKYCILVWSSPGAASEAFPGVTAPVPAWRHLADSARLACSRSAALPHNPPDNRLEFSLSSAGGSDVLMAPSLI